MNLGLIPEKPKPCDQVVGSFTAVKERILRQDHNYTSKLPVVEYQNNGRYDRMGCVSFSLENSFEIQGLMQTGLEYNWSDRFLAKASGTTKRGNTLSKVFDTAQSVGICYENQYPDVLTNWDDYYKPLTQDLYNYAKEFKNKWVIHREWVPPYRRDLILHALKQAPLQVTVKYASGPGILKPTGQHNHAVIIFNAVKNKYWEIFDHYTQVRKKYAWDYEFGTILKPIMTLNDNYNFMKFKQNHPYLLVEGPEQKLGMFLDGEMIIGNKVDILLNSASRLKKYLPPIPVTLKDWDSVEHLDLKGNKI